MFERYTEKARRVIFFARYEASQFGARAIEPEHLLLGLLRDNTRTARLLISTLGGMEVTRRKIEGRVTLGEKISTSVELPLSPETKRVLAYAHEECDYLEHHLLGTEHLLLGLLREEGSIAAEILYEHGLRLDDAREEARGATIDDLIAQAKPPHETRLDLSRRGLTEVPKSVRQLSHLRTLILNKNRLKDLPEFIGLLTNLEFLDLSDNELTSLPASLISSRSLRALFLHGNDDLGIPLPILGPTAEEVFTQNAIPAAAAGILEYYSRIRRRSRSLNEAKLVLVGRGEAGKTSIVNRLVYNSFRDEEKTEGIQITKWDLPLGEGDRARLNIWDFGGQEIMHATHQFFLTQHSIYLLVLNGRSGAEDADAEYWLKLIESFGGASPVIVVLNKIKAHPFDMNRRGLQQKYPAIRDFIKTDCEDNSGIDELREAIERETGRLERLRDSFPESWFAIKIKLAGMRSNYLSYEEYRAQCSELGEGDPSAQDLLSSYLHTLGVVLNYKDDPRLQDTHVLNPHWVTNGIYTILNSELLERQRGEIRLTEVTGILDAGDYPAKMHRFLFDLMKKFELCFSFPDDDCHYLIPELLDKQEPGETADFNPLECLNFQYHYPVLPEGLLPRFIVRTHILSEGLPRWRTGVVLKFEANRALVKADVQDRKVYISVSGPTAGRRRLLAIIRSDFEHIHKGIRNLDPLEMVPLPARPDAVIPFQELLVMEHGGMKTFPKVVNNKIVELDVNELLNGLDLEKTRRRIGSTEEWRRPVFLFYSYSHKDEGLRNELETHLKLLQRQGMIETWHDRKIDPGSEWKEKIHDNLERADIILLLVSADFLASDYCYDKEMARALERREAGEALVVPIIVRDVNWRIAPFAKLQALPKDGLAITKWADKDSAWRDVSEGIERLVNEVRAAAEQSEMQ